MSIRHDSENRRRYERWPVALQAECSVLSDGEWKGAHVCENISAGGALIVGPGGLRVGEKLQLTVRITSLEPIEVKAEVRRASTRNTASIEYGVEFRDLSADDEDLIQSTILAVLEQDARGDDDNP
jgi:c-di-GMP-binding flagellar brake protein YcgR